MSSLDWSNFQCLDFLNCPPLVVWAVLWRGSNNILWCWKLVLVCRIVFNKLKRVLWVYFQNLADVFSRSNSFIFVCQILGAQEILWLTTCKHQKWSSKIVVFRSTNFHLDGWISRAGNCSLVQFDHGMQWLLLLFLTSVYMCVWPIFVLVDSFCVSFIWNSTTIWSDDMLIGLMPRVVSVWKSLTNELWYPLPSTKSVHAISLVSFDTFSSSTLRTFSPVDQFSMWSLVDFFSSAGYY